ncbi:MAG: glycosyltransferase [Hyphomonadaceae bacterium]|nr:glycosyltransferase [Hyphomonadaceae bacterium]
MSIPQGALSFSIVTVTRNAGKHIGDCLRSVAMQTHPHVEHVIIDAQSRDGTEALVAEFGRNATFVSEPDDGIYDAMNKGVRLARGAYILFLGADDLLADERALADAAAFLEREGRPDLVYGDLHVREADGSSSVFRPPQPEEALAFMVYGCLPHQSTLAKHAIFEAPVGLFDKRYCVHGDYDWFLRAFAARGLRILYMPRTIGSFFGGGASNQLERSHKELCAIQNAYPPFREPEWLERRLLRFQDQTLAYRLMAQGRGNGLDALRRRADAVMGRLFGRHG